MTKTEILKVLDNRSFVILTTMNGNMPESRALVNIRSTVIAPHLAEYFKKNDRILFMTNTHSDKIGQIRANPTASLYMYDDGFSGLLLTGRITEVTDSATINALWDDSWKMYYPDGRDGGDFSVLEFFPENFKTYSGTNFEKTKGRVE